MSAATPKLTTVYITGRDGGRYATNVCASSTREAADQAVAWFNDPFWKGPKPAADTVLEIAPMGVSRTFRVRAYPR